MKRVEAMRMIRFLPNVSARWPVMGLAMRAKRDVAEVMRDLSSMVRDAWSRSVPMLTSVEEMTPVLFFRCN